MKKKKSSGSYSLTFLKVVKSFSTVLDLQDKITISIKTDTPLKIQISFKKLNKTSLTYYLAPRVPEEDFDEEEKDDFNEDDYNDFDEKEEETAKENQEEK